MNIKEEYPNQIENGVTTDVSRKKKSRQASSDKKNKNNDCNEVVVTKMAFCDLHTPLHTVEQINVEDDEETG